MTKHKNKSQIVFLSHGLYYINTINMRDTNKTKLFQNILKINAKKFFYPTRKY